MSMIGRTSPTHEAGTPRYLQVSKGWRNGLPQYGSIVACVVRGVQATAEFDGEGAKGWRNCVWSSNKATAMYVSDLEISCQVDVPVIDNRTYGNQYKFYCHGMVDEREAHAMTKTYERLRAAHEKLVTAEGHVSSQDYAHWLLRNGAILGVHGYVFPLDPNDKHLRLDEAHKWVVVSSRGAVYQSVLNLVTAAFSAA